MWITELASLINNNSNSNDFSFMIAKVSSTSPLIIEVGGQAISKYLYINILLKNNNSDIEDNHILKKNDTIVVMQISTSFYILEKVEVVA
ncbi:MAG: hypothetical protein R3Y29_04440 [bacterium]